MLEALIFDVDGTLSETEELHRQAFNQTFAARDLDWHWTRDDYRRLLTTTGGKERIARHIAELGADPGAFDIPALHRDKTDRYTALMAAGGATLRPGIAELIASARASGLRLAVATTTSRPNVEALTRATFGRPAEAVFDVLACGDEVPAKKPAPDVYLLALHRLGLPPGAALALEDSRNGLRAARAAGLACVVSPSVYTESEDFAGAAAVLDDFTAVADLKALAQLLAAERSKRREMTG
ncbi:HAD-IA family hydrolase [Tabrizicola flagellatus]|uniref:HAD-IA family hydrolase n=1 Tax=Tabrizicola flagellatus TaxID=2593021 RepID=UPI00190F29B1|nr:HAD-IA family hydrolase [Tabrizicola flagellatus]